MGVRVPVQILADDTVSRAGIGSVLRYRPGLEVVESIDREDTTVARRLARAISGVLAIRPGLPDRSVSGTGQQRRGNRHRARLNA
jgi:hypothetical protein